MPLPTKLLIKSTVRTLKTRIIPNKKASEEANLLNGAEYGSLLELFNKTLRPILNTPSALILFNDIKNYLELAA